MKQIIEKHLTAAVLTASVLTGICSSYAVNDNAYTMDRIQRDWILQDHGAKVEECFASGANADIENKMVTKVLAENPEKKLNALQAELLKANTPGNDPRWKQLYMNACSSRRAKRLASLLKQTDTIVFTKHFNMGGSHYAYTEAQSDAQAERNFRPGTALCIMKIDGINAKEETLIEDKDGVIRDPDISYDGKNILFSWKKSDKDDDYHLYEMNIATRKVRQLTFGLGVADYEGVYLPDGNIIFNSTRCIEIVDCWWTEVSNIFICDKDGKLIRRLGFDQVHTNYPQVLEDGRVIYTRWDYNDRGQLFPQPLFQMNIDGTGQTEYYGNNSWFPTTIMHARGIPGSNKLLAIISGHHSRQQGEIGIVDTSKGRQEESGIQLIAPVRETKSVRIDSYGQGDDLFQYPYPINEHEFVTTFAPVKSDPAGNESEHKRDSKRYPNYGIYHMDVDGNRELLTIDKDISCNQPVFVMNRKVPFIRPSTVDYRKKTGTYYVQDVYYGPGLEGVERGTVKKLRVVELQFRAVGIGNNGNGGPGGGAMVSTPVSVRNGTWDVKVILGDATVHEDGSAFFEVPARTPVYFQLLDKDNRLVQGMRSWSTLMPGENFSCVGCHENKNTVPLTGGKGSTMAMKAGAQKLKPFYGAPRGFSFPKEIQPILDKHCIKCHMGAPRVAVSADNKEGDLKIDVNKATKVIPAESQWKYTTEKPSADWYKPDFDDSKWKEGKAGFGTSAPGAKVGTRWDTGEIWMRRTFEMPIDVKKENLFLHVYHDEDVKIYLNGEEASQASGYVTKYIPLKINDSAVCTCQPGKNTIAVSCKQTGGGQNIDVAVMAADESLNKPVKTDSENVALAEGIKKAFSLKSTGVVDGGAGRVWSHSYLALTQNGNPNDIVKWMNVQSIPPMIPPYFAGSTQSKIIKMLEEGHNKVKLSQEELDKISAWIDLLVPYCGDYLEANAWDDAGLEKFWRFQRKREQYDNMELDAVEQYTEQQTGKPLKIDRKPPMQAAVTSSEYRNVALNPMDKQDAKKMFPHASSNSECRNTPCFMAICAIDGKKENKGHGGNFPSWGPEQVKNAWWKVEFGRKIEIDKAVIYIRADFPHDAFWKTATLEFSDGSKEKITFEKTADPQEFKFAKRSAAWMKITDLVQDEPLGWCALTEVEVWGK